MAGSNPFPLQNLPYGMLVSLSALYTLYTFLTPSSSTGVFSHLSRHAPRVGVAIGDYVLDLSVLSSFGLLDGLGYSSHIFGHPDLNLFMALDRSKWVSTRNRLTDLLQENGKDDRLRSNTRVKAKAFVPLAGRSHIAYLLSYLSS